MNERTIVAVYVRIYVPSTLFNFSTISYGLTMVPTFSSAQIQRGNAGEVAWEAPLGGVFVQCAKAPGLRDCSQVAGSSSARVNNASSLITRNPEKCNTHQKSIVGRQTQRLRPKAVASPEILGKSFYGHCLVTLIAYNTREVYS